MKFNRQVLPLFVMQTFNWSTTGAGLIFIALYVSGFAGAYINKIISQAGPRVSGATAFMLVANTWILMRLVEQNTTEDLVLLVGLLTLLGMAISTIEIIAMAEIFRAIDDHEKDTPEALDSLVPRAYALFHIAFAGGQLLGPTLAGLLEVYAGWATMTTTLGLLCGFMLVIVLRFGQKQLDTTATERNVSV